MTSARDLVVRLQATRDHSVHELRGILENKGFSTREIEDAIAWSQDFAGQSDTHAATFLVERERRKSRGALRIGALLQARGLDPSAADAHSAEERQRAENLLRSRLARYAGAPERAASFLARQGFEEDVVRSVVETLVGRLEN